MRNFANTFFVLLLGLAIGSFLNVLITRIPGKLTILGRSRCDSCAAPIPASKNIPIFSYLILKGKCAHCGQHIGINHFIVEVITPLLLAIGLYLTSDYFSFAIWILIVSFGIPLAIIDLREHRLPNSLNYLFAITVLFCLALESLKGGDITDLRRAIEQGFVLMFFYLLVRIVSRGGMGIGDVKLSFTIGIISGYFGKYMIYFSTYTAFILGSLFAIILLMIKKANRKKAIPFGPFMIIGLALSFLYLN